MITPMVKVGAGLVGGGFIGSQILDPSDKKKLADRYVATVGDLVGHRISDEKIRTALWNNYQSLFNVLASSPVFYGMYHAIHSSGWPIRQHMYQAATRGVTGSLATVPAFVGMYGTAAVALPLIQSQYMKHGISEEKAKSLAEATVFLGLAAPLECGAEALGCGVAPKQMRSRLFPFATTLIAVRLLTGVLLQYRAVDDAHSQEHKYTDLATSIAGTTVAQHGINAAMKSLSKSQGFSEVFRYLRFGTGTSYRSGAMQLGGTLAQRVLFVGAWNELSHREVKRPEWARN